MSQQLSPAALLEIVQWHIDRYDRLRASTSSRAAVLLSANAALLTGTIVLASRHVADGRNRGIVWWVLGAFALIVVVLTAVSIQYCVNAIATWRTTRSLHRKEISSRFLFNWGDTIRAVDGLSDFSNTAKSLDGQSLLDHGLSELWTGILQHKRRHKYLRYGVHTFRSSLLLFVILVSVVLINGT